MKFDNKDKQGKMLANNIKSQEVNNNNKQSEITTTRKNKIDSIIIKKQYPKKLNKCNDSKNIKKVNTDIKKELAQNKLNDEIKNSLKEAIESKSSYIQKMNNDEEYIDNQQNINGNIDNLFDSDSSLSSISLYESDDLSDNEKYNNNEIIKYKNEINHNSSNSKKEMNNMLDSINNTNEIENNLYFDDSSSITSLSSLGYDECLSTSSISPIKPKRKLDMEEKFKSEKNIDEKNVSLIEFESYIPRKKRRGRKKSDITNLSNSQQFNKISNITETEQSPPVIKKKRGRKRKNEKITYNNEQLQKINQNINNMWKDLYEKLNKNPIDFEIPDNIVNDFEGLIKNPKNGNYINSYEWNIVKMSDDGKITAFLTSDTFNPKNIKCSKCQETIKEDKKYYCEYCNSYYHYRCINENDDIKDEFKKEIIQIDNPVDIFKKAYNLNLSNNYLVHNADFKWCLQKKWICPYHSDKNFIPKPKLKHINIPEEKMVSSNISSPKYNREDSSSTISSKKSVSQKKKKDECKLNQLNSNCTNIITHMKKRSRNFSITSTGSNNKPEICLKKRENILLKFISNNDLSSTPKKNIVLSKKKNIKLDPDIDTNIYINLKNEDLLSSNIINKVIPKESLEYQKPEIKYKTTEEQIKMNFIDKVYKSSKEMEEWLYSLVHLHQDIMNQLHTKNIIKKIPPSPPLNEPSTYLIDTLCSAIVSLKIMILILYIYIK